MIESQQTTDAASSTADVAVFGASEADGRKPIRVLLVDDHQMVRDGLGALLQRDPDIELIGVASSGDEAVRKSDDLAPDVVVLDVCMPGMNGIDAAEQIRGLVGTQVVALSAQGDPTFIQQMAQAGARGFVLKDQSAEDLRRAIHRVQAGECFFPGNQPLPAPNPKAPRLSERERALLAAMAQGDGSRDDLAKRMGISAKTVDSYRQRVMKKLGFSTKEELLRYVTVLKVQS